MATNRLEPQVLMENVTFREATMEDVGKLNDFYEELSREALDYIMKIPKARCQTKIASGDMSWEEWMWADKETFKFYVAEEDGKVIATMRYSLMNGGETGFGTFSLGHPKKKGVYQKLYYEAWKHFLSVNPQLKELWGTVDDPKAWTKRNEAVNSGKIPPLWNRIYEMGIKDASITHDITVCYKIPKDVLAKSLPEEIDEIQYEASQQSEIKALADEEELMEIFQNSKAKADLFPGGILMVTCDPFYPMPVNAPLIFPHCLLILKTTNKDELITALSFATPFESSEDTFLDVNYYGVESYEEVCKHILRHIKGALKYGSCQILNVRLFAPIGLDVKMLQETIQKLLDIPPSKKEAKVQAITYGEVSPESK